MLVHAWFSVLYYLYNLVYGVFLLLFAKITVSEHHYFQALMHAANQV